MGIFSKLFVAVMAHIIRENADKRIKLFLIFFQLKIVDKLLGLPVFMLTFLDKLRLDSYLEKQLLKLTFCFFALNVGLIVAWPPKTICENYKGK